MLDSHPDVVLRNEHHLLQFAEAGRYASRRDVFDHVFYGEPGKNGQPAEPLAPITRAPRVAGAKKGHRTTELFRRDFDRAAAALAATLRLTRVRKLRVLHVVRDPYDNVASITLNDAMRAARKRRRRRRRPRRLADGDDDGRRRALRARARRARRARSRPGGGGGGGCRNYTAAVGVATGGYGTHSPATSVYARTAQTARLLAWPRRASRTTRTAATRAAATRAATRRRSSTCRCSRCTPRIQASPSCAFLRLGYFLGLAPSRHAAGAADEREARQRALEDYSCEAAQDYGLHTPRHTSALVKMSADDVRLLDGLVACYDFLRPYKESAARPLATTVEPQPALRGRSTARRAGRRGRAKDAAAFEGRGPGIEAGQPSARRPRPRVRRAGVVLDLVEPVLAGRGAEPCFARSCARLSWKRWRWLDCSALLSWRTRSFAPGRGAARAPSARRRRSAARTGAHCT